MRNIDTNILYKFFEVATSFEEECRIRTWMEADPANRLMFFKARRTFDAACLSGTLNPAENAKSKSVFMNRRIWMNVLKVAAIILFTWTFTSLYYHFSQKEAEIYAMQSIYVPAGQRINITLPDGTNVWLNARTRLDYPAVFGKDLRQVQLDGEAYFDVSKDKNRPFVVETDKCNIEVLGTEFNVDAYPDMDDFSVSLLEGSVKLLTKNDTDTLLLKPSYKAFIGRDGRFQTEEIDDYNALRWKEGLICFKSASFQSIMKSLEKYFGVSIVVSNEQALKSNYSGKFRQTDGVDHALRVLQKDIRFTYQRDEDNQIIFIR